jgi:CRP/FNR family cyclic AMP-dependent transcriptional regulator
VRFVPLTTEQKADWLTGVPLFAGISDESMRQLAAVAGEQEFAEGQFIVRQGQVGTGLYLVVDGSVSIVRGANSVLATLGPGDFFGEMSVIDQQPRNASAQATTPTTVLAVASWDLLALLENDPALSLNLIKGLVARIRAAGEQHRH